MLKLEEYRRSSNLAVSLGLLAVPLAAVMALLFGLNPLYIGGGFVGIAVCIAFFTHFEQTVLGLLILRSFLDLFSKQQVPAIFGTAIISLSLIYIIKQILTRQRILTDKFLWFFALWVVLQGLWVVLLPLGAFDASADAFPTALREWVRLSSWVSVYFLITQLREQTPPQRVVNALFIGLIPPLVVAAIQIIIPPSLLPSFLVFETSGIFETGSRISGSLGHPNTFGVFLLFFVGLTVWRWQQSAQSIKWLLLLGALVAFISSTKAIAGLAMLFVLVPLLIAPRLKASTLFGGVILLVVSLVVFTSTDFGRERLASLSETPLLNPDIDPSVSILTSWYDRNSFNWRIAQWTFLLQAWQQSPILGNGLATSPSLTVLGNFAHNDYIRALAEGGILGLFLFILFLGGQFLRLMKVARLAPPNSKQRGFCLTLMAILVVLCIGMLTENIWTHTTTFFYWWAASAIAEWNWDTPQESEDSSLITYSNAG